VVHKILKSPSILRSGRIDTSFNVITYNTSFLHGILEVRAKALTRRILSRGIVKLTDELESFSQR
jgi:hypothetical protein